MRQGSQRLPVKTQWLYTFMCLVELKTLNMTSFDLELTEQSIRNHINALESFYQVKLIYFEQQKVVLTGRGQALYIQAKELIKGLNQTKKLTHKRSSVNFRLGGHLRICSSFVVDAVLKLSELHEIQAELSLISGANATNKIQEALLNQNIDMGIAITPAKNPLIQSQAGPVISYLVAGNGTPVDSYESLDFVAQPSLLQSNTFQVEPQIMSQIDNMSLLIAAQGKLATLCSEDQIRHLIESESLVSLAPCPEYLKFQIHLLWLANRKFSPALLTFQTVFQQLSEKYKSSC